jgi:purine nucleoside phosphorylase
MRSKVGVVLGSGLDAFAEVLENQVETAYAQIAGWPISTVSGHAGKLVEGRIGRTDVVVLVGRAHLYEGYTARQINVRRSRTGPPRRGGLGADQCGRRHQLELGISCVTNMAAGVLPRKLNHSEVLEVGERVGDRLAKLLACLVPRLAESSVRS